MKVKHNIHNITKIALFVVGAVTLCLLSPAVALSALPPLMQGTAKTAPPILTKHQKQMIAAFNRHVEDYLEQRRAVAKKLPKLSKEATPEQIEAYQRSFVAALRAMRAGTKQGYIYTPEFSEYVRTIIKTDFPAKDRAEIRENILEAETKGVPLQVNFPYPETKEVTAMPATLLLKLPQLPKEVKYRFVRRHLLLVDTDNGLIVDYALNALP
jgi:ABC-type transporter MlaC component